MEILEIIFPIFGQLELNKSTKVGKNWVLLKYGILEYSGGIFDGIFRNLLKDGIY